MATEVVKAAVNGLALLRLPFPENQISKLPKHGTYLSYVGHAALTDRLLDADPNWSWEPMAVDPMGLPMFDSTGGLWIRLTVCGVTRIGYGHAAEKKGMDPGNREKEVIGDALRNAAMRFGAALDLWHKGELHASKDEPEVVQGQFVEETPPKQLPAAEKVADKKVAASPPKASTNGASVAKSSAPAPAAKTTTSAVASAPTKSEIPEHGADKLKDLITSGMKQLGWKMLKLREFYEAHVDPEPFKSADEMPIEKMRLLHAKMVEKHGIAPF